MLTVTTSWDDGDVLDQRLADLLDRYELKGTFYITKQYRPERLADTDIRALAVRHEIGAHTLTHPDLRRLSPEQQREEIAGSKKWLEEVMGAAVPMFCYPSGAYNQSALQVTKDAGFLGARTVEFGRIDAVFDAFQMPTTLHVYPMPFRKVDAHRFWWRKLAQPLMERGPVFRTLGVPFFALRSWETLARASFDSALENGEVFHLWGHSWEIEQYDLWEALERVLRYISKRPNCRYVSNNELLHKRL